MAVIQQKADRSKIVRMDISNRVILTPDTSITFENREVIEKVIQSAMAENKTQIILDCRHVELMDSAALELLIEAHRELRERGGMLKIVGLNEVCSDILMVTRMVHTLFVYKDIQDALRNIG